MWCPRCGNEAASLHGDVYILVKCDFCGDVIDAVDLAPQGELSWPQAAPAPPVPGTPRPGHLTTLAGVP